MIRPAIAPDADVIVVLEEDCFGTEAWGPGLVNAEIDGETCHVLVDETDGVVRAYASLSVGGDVADLRRIAVVSAARRHGVARELLSALVGRAAERGAARILLEVADGNAAAIALYESFGFATISRRSRYYADGADSLVMQLAVQETR